MGVREWEGDTISDKGSPYHLLSHQRVKGILLLFCPTQHQPVTTALLSKLATLQVVDSAWGEETQQLCLCVWAVVAQVVVWWWPYIVPSVGLGCVVRCGYLTQTPDVEVTTF